MNLAQIQLKRRNQEVVSKDTRVLERSRELLKQHGGNLCVSYVDPAGILTTIEGCVTPTELLAASKSSYFDLYLRDNTSLAKRGSPPPKMSKQEQWNLLDDEDKKMFIALGIKPPFKEG